MYDKYYEYYVEGESCKSRGRTITETNLVIFYALTGDYYPLLKNKGLLTA